MNYRVKRGWIFHYQDPTTEETYMDSVTMFRTPTFKSLAEAEIEYKAIDLREKWKLESNWASRHKDNDSGELPIYIMEFVKITQVNHYNGLAYDAATVAERRYENLYDEDNEWEVE